MVFKYSKDIYSKSALLKAAYAFTDIAYVHLDSENRYYIVEITKKNNDVIFSEEEFKNELLSQMVKETIRNETKNVRELVLARAFSSTLISEECEENIDQLDNYELDEILEDWFDKYGKDKIN